MRGLTCLRPVGGGLRLDRITKRISKPASRCSTPTRDPGFSIRACPEPRRGVSMFADSNSPWRPFFLIGLSLAALVLVAGILTQQPPAGPSHRHRLVADPRRSAGECV